MRRFAGLLPKSHKQWSTSNPTRRPVMARVSLRQLLDHAAENRYGLPAFNVNNLEQVQRSWRPRTRCNPR